MSRSPHRSRLPFLAAVALALGCEHSNRTPSPLPPVNGTATETRKDDSASRSATQDVADFVSASEAQLEDTARIDSHIYWLEGTHRTVDTEALSTWADAADSKLWLSVSRRAKMYQVDDQTELARKLKLLQLGTAFPVPSDDAKANAAAVLGTRLASTYSQFANCRELADCKLKNELYATMRTSSDPSMLLDAWSRWMRLGKAVKDDYLKYVEIVDEGAKELGYSDLATLWRSRYDMSSVEFEAMLDREWEKVAPLYQSLHCYARIALRRKYGASAVRTGEAIPAHLFGDMWAQYWPAVAGGPADDLSDRVNVALRKRHRTAEKMVRLGESSFESIGFPKLPETFWERSMLKKPRDREVNCQGLASPMGDGADVRMRMCVEPTFRDLMTIHHELGHVYYYLAYREQPHLFRAGANDGFHEAVGDAVALSVTPRYLAGIGLSKSKGDRDDAQAQLLSSALERLPRVAVERVVSTWQEDVAGGKIKGGRYNAHFWELRRSVQGVAQPMPRTEEDFDAGAFYHIPNNTRYARYFFASILQFQIHRALCGIAEHHGPLHECSIFGSKAAGQRLWKMLELGASRPWQEAIESIAGTRELDASGLIEYYAPLKIWLDEQNKGETCSW